MASGCLVVSPVGAAPLHERVCLLPGLWHQCVFLLLPGGPWFQPRETTGEGGHPHRCPLQLHQVKLLWFGGHSVGGAGGKLKPVVNSAKINQPFKSCPLTRVYRQAGPSPVPPVQSPAEPGWPGRWEGKGEFVFCFCFFYLNN